LTQTRSAIRLASAITAALLLASISVLLAPVADASASGFATCLGTNHETYTPGLSFHSQDIQFYAADTYTTCTSSDPTLTAGSDTFAAELMMSCAQPVAVGSYILDVHWNNGKSSTFSLTSTILSEVAGQIVVAATGTVVAGEFNGAAVIAQFTQLAPDLLKCLSGGVTSASGTSTLQITAT
jgi:hypothetical protein